MNQPDAPTKALDITLYPKVKTTHRAAHVRAAVSCHEVMFRHDLRRVGDSLACPRDARGQRPQPGAHGEGSGAALRPRMTDLGINS